jgi:hypothetical protein
MKGQPMLQKIVDRFPKVKILVVGDIMLDRFIWGKVSRISPEAPVPVVLMDNHDKSETLGLGGAAKDARKENGNNEKQETQYQLSTKYNGACMEPGLSKNRT